MELVYHRPMKKALLALLLVAAGLVATQYLKHQQQARERARHAAKWEAIQAAEKERSAAWRRKNEAERKAESDRRIAEIALEMERDAARFHAEQAAYRAETEAIRARTAEMQARRAAASPLQRSYSNPASVENLRAQGVPRWFYESEQPRRPAPEIRVHVEPDPGHYQINETVPGFFTVRPR